MIIKFTIPGKPLAKQRPRFTRAGRTYTPEATVMYENLIKTCFAQAYPDHIPVTCPVKMEIRAYYPIAESWPKKKKAAALFGVLKPAKPDWDNVGKIVSDALNQIAYVDDAQAWDCHVVKVYDTAPRIDVTIEWKDET